MNKNELVDTAKTIFLHALLPTLLMVLFFISVQWFIAGIWLYLNYESMEITKLTIAGILAGGLPLIAWISWGLRRFITKGYDIIHQTIIHPTLIAYLDAYADKLLQTDYYKTAKSYQESPMAKAIEHLLQKTEELPTLPRRLSRLVLGKITIVEDLSAHLSMIEKGDKKEIIRTFDNLVTDRLMDASKNIVPPFFKYLAPISILMTLALWVL